MAKLTCFKSYDIRGVVGTDIDADVAYRVGRATAQHLRASSVVIGFDARETSSSFAAAVSKGVIDAGSDVIEIGLSGTEEMYWAVTEFHCCAGITVTASHNPINHNGFKIVKANSCPLNKRDDFDQIKILAETQSWIKHKCVGSITNMSKIARAQYVNRVLSFVDLSELKPFKIVVNSGNGAAGPTFDQLVKKMSLNGVDLDIVRVSHEPDKTFPNGVPNPLLKKNHAATADVIRSVGADFGVAFDGDFDRCFFFDGSGNFVPSEYIVGLLASIFLEKKPGEIIIHDTRTVWNIIQIVEQSDGMAVQSKTGHAYMKKTMRKHKAVYGGELSGHHYFREFAYCDSGMIPWLLMLHFLSINNISLKEWVQSRVGAFPSSGEINFSVKDSDHAMAIILDKYKHIANEIDFADGLSCQFDDWRFNLRKSNTENLLRLNIEARGNATIVSQKVSDISALLQKETH